MKKTIGELIDELCIINLKIWHYLDKQQDVSLSESDRLQYANKVLQLNIKRNKIIASIDNDETKSYKEYK